MMAYARGNPPTKKALKALVAAGDAWAFDPSEMREVREGRNVIEGPHFPKPHRWYASVMVEDGQIVKVLS